MDRFEYALSHKEPIETEYVEIENVKLYDGDNKTNYKDGVVKLTSHRLLWIHPETTANNTLSMSLEYVVYFEEEKPGAFQFTRSSKLVLHLATTSDGKQPGPVPSSYFNYVKLSFKHGLDTRFVSYLNHAINERKWEAQPLKPLPGTSSKARPPIKTRTGITGIERSIQEKQKATDESISVAFQDLSKLMKMAKDMVTLSKTVSDKIRERQGDITDDETVKFKSYLLSLGIDDPVTRDSYSSEGQYMDKLARQLVEILEKPITELGGMMSLADAFCRVNRARGLELLSPQDMLNACKHLQKLDLSLMLRKFSSGVMVLQLTTHSDEAIVISTAETLNERGSLTAEELAQELGISVLLAKERLKTTEVYGRACRDESIEGLRFFPNWFLERAD